jgi:hypothetical protein
MGKIRKDSIVKTPLRTAADYSLLKDALIKHIETLSFDHVFYVANLVGIAKDNGYTEAHLSMAISTLSRTGHIERVGFHKKMYQNIGHYRRGKNPKQPKTAPKKKPQNTIDERAQQMNEASMRLWHALGMPVVRDTNQLTA